MGIVKKLQVNSSNETTGATILKGNKEIVDRHVSSIIPLLSVNEYNSDPTGITGAPEVAVSPNVKSKRKKRKKRKAAISSEQRTKALFDSE